MSQLKPRERDAMIQALCTGVVPKFGLRHLQVGRALEVEALIKDIDRIADGGAAIRFIIGDYGSGKTFLLNLIRIVALEKGLVTMFADLAPDRRLQATGGQARALYAELAANLSTRAKSDGGALASIVERFIAQAHHDAEASGIQTAALIMERLRTLQELTGGFDFAHVVKRYWEGHEAGDEDCKSAALRWLRGEFTTRSEARAALGVRSIIEDAGVYDHLKLMAAFVRQAGYKGLLVGLDEMVNLFKLTSSQARSANYEQILRILNDILQGSAKHLGFVMGGTPEFLMHSRRGLYSYEALQSRLAPNAFARNGLVDYSHPIIALANLTPEDLFVLLSKVRAVMDGGDEDFPDSAIQAFMAHCAEQIGDAYFRTPRDTVKAFAGLLAVLAQNPEVTWQDLLGSVTLATEGTAASSDLNDNENAPGAADDDDGLASFRL